MELKSVTFTALMKKLEIKSLASCDKGGRLLLEFNVTDDALIADLNQIMKADGTVEVTVKETES